MELYNSNDNKKTNTHLKIESLQNKNDTFLNCLQIKFSNKSSIKYFKNNNIQIITGIKTENRLQETVTYLTNLLNSFYPKHKIIEDSLNELFPSLIQNKIWKFIKSYQTYKKFKENIHLSKFGMVTNCKISDQKMIMANYFSANEIDINNLKKFLDLNYSLISEEPLLNRYCYKYENGINLLLFNSKKAIFNITSSRDENGDKIFNTFNKLLNINF